MAWVARTNWYAMTPKGPTSTLTVGPSFGSAEPLKAGSLCHAVVGPHLSWGRVVGVAWYNMSCVNLLLLLLLVSDYTKKTSWDVGSQLLWEWVTQQVTWYTWCDNACPGIERGVPAIVVCVEHFCKAGCTIIDSFQYTLTYRTLWAIQFVYNTTQHIQLLLLYLKRKKKQTPSRLTDCHSLLHSQPNKSWQDNMLWLTTVMNIRLRVDMNVLPCMFK